MTGRVVGKSVPVMSMLLSGAIDALTTKGIGEAAKQWFITEVPDVLTIDAEFEEAD